MTDLNHSSLRLLNFLRNGEAAVSAFLVISGFSLMLSAISEGKLKITGGYFSYFKRRMKRVLPAYYSSILFCLALYFAFRGVPAIGTLFDGINTSALLAHLLLLQNITDQADKIAPPLWSVSLECFMYGMFPFILLPILKKWGPLRLFIFSVLAALCFDLLPMASRRSDLIVSFSMGMIGALIYKGSLSNWKPEKRYFGIAMLAVIISTWHKLDSLSWNYAMMLNREIIPASLTSILILYLTSQYKTSYPARKARALLENQSMQFLGKISYSLYLLHWPIVFVAYNLCPIDPSFPRFRFFYLSFTGVSLSIIAAWISYRLIEKPFRNRIPAMS